MARIIPDGMTEAESCALQIEAKDNRKGSSVRSMLLNLVEGVLV
jgi:hypothetical protein